VLAGAAPLSNTIRAGLDPCAALDTRFDRIAGETEELDCFLGAAP